MRPARAPATAWASVACSASRRSIAESAAIIQITACGSVCATSRAAAATAGAELRPTGSSTMRASAMPASRNCSATRKRCSWLQTTTGGGEAGAAAAQRGLHDHRAVVVQQAPELLGEALARHRPQPGAGAAGQDDGHHQPSAGCGSVGGQFSADSGSGGSASIRAPFANKPSGAGAYRGRIEVSPSGRCWQNQLWYQLWFTTVTMPPRYGAGRWRNGRRASGTPNWRSRRRARRT